MHITTRILQWIIVLYELISTDLIPQNNSPLSVPTADHLRSVRYPPSITGQYISSTNSPISVSSSTKTKTPEVAKSTYATSIPESSIISPVSFYDMNNPSRFMPFSYQKAESNELFKIFDSPKNSHEVKTYPENLNSFTQSFSNIPESFQNFPSFDFDPSVLPFSVEDSIFQSNPSSGISQVITRSTHNSDSKEPMLVPNPNSRYLPYSQTPHHSSYTSSRIRSDQKSPFEQSTSIYKNPSQYAIQYPTWTVPSHVPPSIPPPGDPLPSPMYLGSDQQGSKRTIDFLRRFSDEGNIENR